MDNAMTELAVLEQAHSSALTQQQLVAIERRLKTQAEEQQEAARLAARQASVDELKREQQAKLDSIQEGLSSQIHSEYKQQVELIGKVFSQELTKADLLQQPRPEARPTVSTAGAVSKTATEGLSPQSEAYSSVFESGHYSEASFEDDEGEESTRSVGKESLGSRQGRRHSHGRPSLASIPDIPDEIGEESIPEDSIEESIPFEDSMRTLNLTLTLILALAIILPLPLPLILTLILALALT